MQLLSLKRSITGDSTIITRRKLLTTTAAGALATMLKGALPSLKMDTDHLLRTYIQLAGSLDERLIIWWMKGKRYGMIGSQVTPLFNVEVGRFFRFFEQAKGSFNLVMFELSYYTDSATGKLLERFSNPFTGAVNDVMRLARRPFISQHTAAGRFLPALKNSAASYRSQVMPLFIDGDRVEIGSRVNAMMPSPFRKEPNTRINEYITVTGRRSDLLDPSTKSAAAELSYQNIQPWEPWMMMGDQPGQMVGWATGRKYESLAEMPSGYLKMARAVHPWLIRDPMETLAVQTGKIRDLSVG